MATRDAALAPGAIDGMSSFEGTYLLAPHNTKTPLGPVEVAISSHNGAPTPVNAHNFQRTTVPYSGLWQRSSAACLQDAPCLLAGCACANTNTSPGLCCPVTCHGITLYKRSVQRFTLSWLPRRLNLLCFCMVLLILFQNLPKHRIRSQMLVISLNGTCL